jgi:probable rRNA maturation factor
MNIIINYHTQSDLWNSFPGFSASVTEVILYNLPSLADVIQHSGDYEFNVILTDDAELQTLNKEYRGKDKPTNVLTFISDNQFAEMIEELSEIPHIVDIYLAHETISKEAKTQNKDFVAHSHHILVHGILHGLGMNHDDDHEAEIMEDLEQEILEQLL